MKFVVIFVDLIADIAGKCCNKKTGRRVGSNKRDRSACDIARERKTKVFLLQTEA
jgi:hypothetical protein